MRWISRFLAPMACIYGGDLMLARRDAVFADL